MEALIGKRLWFSILGDDSMRTKSKINYPTISTFSGAMGMDNGLEKAGFDIRLAVEIEKAMCDTIRLNKPALPLISDDIRNYSGDELLKRAGLRPGELFLLCGGPPCQAFSTAGKRRGLDDERGNVFLKFISLIGELRPKYFLIENVRGLLSASYTPPNARSGYIAEKGSALAYLLNQIEEIGYSYSFTLYDAANYGVPQRRERVVIIGSRENYRIPLVPPTHNEHGTGGLKPWVSLRNAIENVKSCTAGVIPARRRMFYEYLSAGQNWKDLPESLQKEAMGKSYALQGGKTGFYRRLSWDKPSPTLVTCPTMPATELCHPDEIRPLSIEEYARIQMFPETWKFSGNLGAIYKQIGNAVPVGLAEAIGKHILWFDSLSEEQKKEVCAAPIELSNQYSRYKGTTDRDFVQQLIKFKQNCVSSWDLILCGESGDDGIPQD